MHRRPARSKDWRRISLILRVASCRIETPKPRGCDRSAMHASMFREGIFDGRTIVITGGGSGIGRCTAHELASLGAKVLITGRTAEKLERTAAEIRQDGGTAAHYVFDIRDEELVRSTVADMLAD